MVHWPYVWPKVSCYLFCGQEYMIKKNLQMDISNFPCSLDRFHDLELRRRFPSHDVWNALGMVYLQCWLNSACEIWVLHCILTSWRCFCCSQSCKEGGAVCGCTSWLRFLEMQDPFFKLTMVHNSEAVAAENNDVNPHNALGSTCETIYSKVLYSRRVPIQWCYHFLEREER